MGRGAGGGASGGMGSRARGPKWGEVTVTIDRFQMRQGGTLLEYEEAAGIDWTDKAKAFLEAEGFKSGQVLSEKTYHGDSRWIAAHDSVMDEHGNWKIGNWDKVKIGSRKEKYNVAKISDSEFMANETLSKIFKF
jgi:hypothetical protein